ncbi:MAG: glycosyltransferase family 9 protein [Phycisphaerales bacterium]|nr:glycosyltransferase family 9 protein [Phycisphaerales bacterium]
MKTVVPVQDMQVSAERGRSLLEFEGGVRYILSDVEAMSGLSAGALHVSDAPDAPPAYRPADFRGSRLAVPFIGGQGDAVALLPVLATIRDLHPGISIEVIAAVGAAQVFALSPAVDRVHPHPMTIASWRGFDAYLPLERIPGTVQAPNAGLARTFAAALGVPLALIRHPLRLPPLGPRTGGPLVVVAVGEAASMRSVPPPLVLQIVTALNERGVASVLVGHLDDAYRFPSRPELLDLRGRTPTVVELANCLRLADAVVAHDSFVMHLAGALERPTLALFAPSSAGIASDYRTVETLSSDAPCAPCGAATGACPLGHGRCVAWDAVGAALDRLIDATCSIAEAVPALG